MINKPENTNQSMSTSTSSTTFEQESVVHFNTHLDPESSNMEKLIRMDTLSSSDFDIYTRLKGDLDQIKRYTGEILHHDRSTVELRRDGSICIIPHPRQLPTEIVTLIINYLILDDNNNQRQQTLYSCTLVNKQFHTICNPLLWEKLIFEDIFFTTNIMRFFDLPIQIDAERFFAGNNLTSSSPQRLSTLGSFIVDLHLHSPHWTDSQLKRWLPHLPNLQNLTIGRTTKITDTSFQLLPANCPQLKSLCLSTSSNHITQPSFSAIGRHAHHLEHLEYHYLENETPEWLPWIMPCPSLKRLKLWFMAIPWTHTTLPTLQSWSQLTHLNLFIANPDIHLKPLIDLATTGYDQAPPPVLDKDQNIHHTTTTIRHRVSTPWWPQLTHLSLFPITDIDDTTWIAFIKTHPKLQDIHLKEANQLTNLSLNAIKVWLPSMTRMALIGENTWMTLDCVRRFIKDMPFLVGLAINVYCQTTAENVLQGWSTDPTDMFLGKLDTMEIEKIKQAE